MKCQYCNNQTKDYQIDTRNNLNYYFPICNHHETTRGKIHTLPQYIPPVQGLRYIAKLQRNSWINLCKQAT